MNITGKSRHHNAVSETPSQIHLSHSHFFWSVSTMVVFHSLQCLSIYSRCILACWMLTSWHTTRFYLFLKSFFGTYNQSVGWHPSFIGFLRDVLTFYLSIRAIVNIKSPLASSSFQRTGLRHLVLRARLIIALYWPILLFILEEYRVRACISFIFLTVYFSILFMHSNPCNLNDQRRE